MTHNSMMDCVKKIEAGQAILASSRTDDQKLFEMFQLYEEDLKKQYPTMYYALLGWKYAHLRELTPPADMAETLNSYFK